MFDEQRVGDVADVDVDVVDDCYFAVIAWVRRFLVSSANGAANFSEGRFMGWGYLGAAC